MSNRALQVGGVAIAAGVGYYLYSAGGDPKTAQKKAEADAAKLSNKVQDKMPGSGKEAQKTVEAEGQHAGAKVDQMARDAKAEAEKAAKTTEKKVNDSIDKFDKNVEQAASKAKGGISSWLGGGGEKK